MRVSVVQLPSKVMLVLLLNAYLKVLCHIELYC